MILEAIYNGDFYPSETVVPKTEKYRKAMKACEKLMDTLAEKLSNPDAKLITTTVTVNLEKNSDGKWIISSPDQNAEFLDALSGGIVNSLTTTLGSLFE